MKLNILQIELTWPEDLCFLHLRKWILGCLRNHGEPLRWAITSVSTPLGSSGSRKVFVEAVVLMNSSKELN